MALGLSSFGGAGLFILVAKTLELSEQGTRHIELFGFQQ